MNRPQRPRRASQPVTPNSLRAAARRLHEMADDLDRCGAYPDMREAAAPVLLGIARYVHHLTERLKL
jgi:hypothetical protein